MIFIVYFQSSCSNIYLNVTTLEGDRYTIELSGSGFRVAGNEHDVADIPLPDLDEEDEGGKEGSVCKELIIYFPLV